jgi:hypothetical protein
MRNSFNCWIFMLLAGILFCSKNPTKSAGNPVKCYMTSYSIYSSQGVLSLTVKYHYDSKKRIANETVIIDNRIMQYSINEYDSSSNRIKKSTYFGDSTLMSFTFYKYNDFGKESETSTFSPDSVLIERWTFEYDAKQYQVKINRLYTNGTSGYILIANDENGNVIRATTYDSSNNIEGYEIYEYANGKLNRIKYYSPADSMNFYIIYEYDSNGNHVRTNHYNPDGSLSQYDLFAYECY